MRLMLSSFYLPEEAPQRGHTQYNPILPAVNGTKCFIPCITCRDQSAVEPDWPICTVTTVPAGTWVPSARD